MSFLNEIRSRINSVKSTRQITSAMKMVASSKHHKAQDAINRFYSYQQELFKILHDFMEYQERERISLTSQYSLQRPIKKVAVVAVSSNMSLCGAFNENVYKEVVATMKSYESLGLENVTLFPIGAKIAKKVVEYPNVYKESLEDLIKNVTFDESVKFAEMLLDGYNKGEYDKIELIYHHCKTSSTQKLLHETYLPFLLEDIKTNEGDKDEIVTEKPSYEINYIFEPDAQAIMDVLIPKLIRLKMYTILLDSAAAEQSARMIAMQIATDNADNLLQSLSIQYNKQRQQSITNELLDIVGGSLN